MFPKNSPTYPQHIPKHFQNVPNIFHVVPFVFQNCPKTNVPEHNKKQIHKKTKKTLVLTGVVGPPNIKAKQETKYKDGNSVFRSTPAGDRAHRD